MVTFFKKSTGLTQVASLREADWTSVVCPTEEEKNFLLRELQVPEAFYNDIEDIDERPRIEAEEGWYLIILRIPYETGDEKLPHSTIPLGVIFKDDVFVTLTFYKNHMLDDFVAYTRRKNIAIGNHFDLVLKLLLSSSVWFQKYLKQINQRIKVAENNLEKSIRNEDLQTLLQIEKCLVFFITSLKGNEMLFYRIKNLKNQKDNYDPDLIEDVEIEIKQAQDTTNVYSDILAGMMDAYASVISNNLNIIMKKLTSISIILMIPTLVASLYGMNVPNVLQDKSYGFLVIVCISLILSLAGVLMFRKRNLF